MEWRRADLVFATACDDADDYRDDVADHALYQRGLKDNTLALLAHRRAPSPQKYRRNMPVAPDAPPVTMINVRALINR